MEHEPHILVVDDEEGVRESVAEYVALQGFSVATAADGRGMRDRIAEREPALVVLDVGLPGEGGLALAQWLRSRGRMGIIMLTGHSDPVDRIVGLEVGADDYIGKPFVPRELVARIRAVLRRNDLSRPPPEAAAATTEAEGTRVRFGTKWLHPGKRALEDDNGRVFPLTTSELGLITAFAEHPRRVLTRERLLDLAGARDAGAFDRAIDVRITRLRRKIEPDPEQPTIIQTVRGAGYIFSPDGRLLH